MAAGYPGATAEPQRGEQKSVGDNSGSGAGLEEGGKQLDDHAEDEEASTRSRDGSSSFSFAEEPGEVGPQQEEARREVSAEGTETATTAEEHVAGAGAASALAAALSAAGDPAGPGSQPASQQQPMQAVPPNLVFRLCITGDNLDMILAGGDLLVVQGNGRLAQIGTAGGLFGHVMVLLKPPRVVMRNSEEGETLSEVWPKGGPTGGPPQELWRLRTLESTRAEKGVYESTMLCYVDVRSRKLVLCGEEEDDGTFCEIEEVHVDAWQSPLPLRSTLLTELLDRAAQETKRSLGSWSARTAVRSIIWQARLDPKGLDEKKLREYWARPPICTSVAIIVWQRYLWELAHLVGPDNIPACAMSWWPGNAGKNAALAREAAGRKLVLEYMPLKADKALPGDLCAALEEAGWVKLTQFPCTFKPIPFPSGAMPSVQPSQATAAKASVCALEARAGLELAPSAGALSGSEPEPAADDEKPNGS